MFFCFVDLLEGSILLLFSKKKGPQGISMELLLFHFFGPPLRFLPFF